MPVKRGNRGSALGLPVALANMSPAPRPSCATPLLVDAPDREAPPRPPPLPQPDTRRDRPRDCDRLKQRPFCARVSLPLPRNQLMDNVHDVQLAAPPPYLPLHQKEAIYATLDCPLDIGGDLHKCAPGLGQYHAMPLLITLCAKCHKEVFIFLRSFALSLTYTDCPFPGR
jgi:hypothetical protein